MLTTLKNYVLESIKYSKEVIGKTLHQIYGQWCIDFGVLRKG